MTYIWKQYVNSILIFVILLLLSLIYLMLISITDYVRTHIIALLALALDITDHDDKIKESCTRKSIIDDLYVWEVYVKIRTAFA